MRRIGDYYLNRATSWDEIKQAQWSYPLWYDEGEVKYDGEAGSPAEPEPGAKNTFNDGEDNVQVHSSPAQ